MSSEGLGLFEGAAVLETRCEFCGLAVVKSPDHMDQGIDFPSSRLAHAAVIPTKVGIQQVGEEPWIPAFARMTKKSWG